MRTLRLTEPRFCPEGEHIVEQASDKYYKRDFWIKENLNYVEPHFRLEKSARIVNRIARGRELDLLDVGCGPATLMHFLESPIKFGDKQFDIVLAQGVFEYIGSHQTEKFSEIKRLLRENGKFILSYVNFDHFSKAIYSVYNNVQTFADFKKSLADIFHVERVIPTSHGWRNNEPTRKFMKRIHMHMDLKIPFISNLLAIEYFYVCSFRDSWNLDVRDAARK